MDVVVTPVVLDVVVSEIVDKFVVDVVVCVIGIEAVLNEVAGNDHKGADGKLGAESVVVVVGA